MKRFLRAFALGIASTLILSFLAILIGCHSEETTESRKKKTNKESKQIEDLEKTEETEEPDKSSKDEGSDTSTPPETDDPSPSSVSDPITTPADQPDDLPDEMATRLSDDLIEDFVPGSDYGEIYPFEGNPRVPQTNYGTVGFFDAQGRIVCDAVYHGAWQYDENGFIIYRYEGDSTYTPAKYGFISHDGSSYTGLIYDDYFFEKDQFYFVNTDNHGNLTVIPFDLESATAGDPIRLKTLALMDESLNHLKTVINDRYLLYVDDYDFPTVVVDGTTGEEVHYPDCGGLFYGTRAGNIYILSTEDYWSAVDPIFAVYKISSEKLYDRTVFTAYQYNGGDQALFREDNGWVVTDLDGNRIYTLVDDPDHPIHSFDQTGDYYIARYDDKIECYSKDFENVRSVDVDSPSEYYTVRDDYSVPTDVGASLSPILYTQDDVTIHFLDPLTGKTGTAPGMNMSGEPMHIPGRILVSYTDYDIFGWAILDDSDFSVIAEGAGNIETIYDKVQEKYYLLVRDGYYSGEASVIDASSGEIILESVLNPEQIRIDMAVYDGKFVYSTVPNFYDDDAGKQHPFTVLTDKDGRITFLYYAENGYAS
ncbi:MAG: DUF1754 domain-containing protein [Clostridiales bacterium]|nr:DUF1754 domain-containing protein [Clostridiales bacterium]